ncbi:MAG: hypothetical protein K0R23_2315 [Lacrimispora sp.]|jgi:sensor histidine kinase YesM|nr:hypothetical protein [Lacrimispora sp.]
MLKCRYNQVLTFIGVAIFNEASNFININCGLYRIFPQELFYFLTSLIMIWSLFQGSAGKKVMVAIFTDGLGYTCNFVFLPLIQYVSKNIIDQPSIYDLAYKLCDILTILLNSAILEWVGRKCRNLHGEITMTENLFLLILCFFTRQTVIYYGLNQFQYNNTLISNLAATGVAVGGVSLITFSSYYADRKLSLLLANEKNIILEKRIAAWQGEDKQLSGFRHDFKNHMLCLRNLLSMEKNKEALNYLDCITGTVNTFYPDYSSGNPYADAIIREKLALARAWEIRLDTDFIFPSTDLIDPTDLCIILSNALDNALEACRRLTGQTDEPLITALSCVQRSFLIIEITNPVPDIQNRNTSPFRSAKEEPHLHGIGLSNIRDAVERCHGTLDLSISEEVFHFCVMLPLFPPFR